MAEAAVVERQPELSAAAKEKVLTRARDRLRFTESKDRKNRQSARADTEFVYVAGKQWDNNTRAKRESWKEMCLEFPQLQQFVNQVVNDQRQNRPGIRVHAASGDASKEVADIIQGMVRGIEYDSTAEAVYDCGYQCSVVGGRGYWRITAEYTAPDSFDQELVLKRIPDPMSVYLDEDFQTPDGRDRNFGYVLETLTKEEFEQRYKDAQPLNFESEDKLWYPDDDHVVIADYYERVVKTRDLLALRGGPIGYRDDLEKVYGQAIPAANILRVRQVEVYSVSWYTIGGGDQILETHFWPGTIIPIVCTMGTEVMVDGERIYMGLISQAKSSQAMFNYGMTQQAIHLALTPRSPYIGEFRQFEGFESMYEQANDRNWAFLPYNAVVEDGVALPPPQRQPGSAPDQGWITWTQQMTALMRSTIGMYENSLGMKGQEVSGRAIKAREMQGDNATFHYADNLARAIALTGEIVVECIPYYYDAERIVHIIGEDDVRKQVTINQQLAPVDPLAAVNAIVKNDVRIGRYSVTVSAGPGYQTRRQETADLMMQLVGADKSGMILQAGADIIVKTQEIPDADVLAERIRVLMPPPVQQVIAAKEAGQDPKMAQVNQQLQQLQQQLQQGGQAYQQLMQQFKQLQQDKSASIAASQARQQAGVAQQQRYQTEAANEQERMQSEVAMRGDELKAQLEDMILKHLGDMESRSIEREKVFVQFMAVAMKALQPPAVVAQQGAEASRELNTQEGMA